MKKLYILMAMIFFSLSAFAQTSPFITTWNTANPGSTDNKTITIPALGSYDITWTEIGGSGYTGTFSGTDLTTLTFPESGIYQVAMTPSAAQPVPFQKIDFGGDDANGIGDSLKLTAITQWGDIQWNNMLRAFYHCGNLEITATDVPDLSNVTTLAQMFQYCAAITTIPNIASWDVSNVEHFEYMFSDASNFNDNINSWDLSAAVYTYSMFDGAALFNQPLNNWNVSNVTNMSYMFAGATSFNQPLNNWNTQNVTNLVATFYGAAAFNQNINSWNVASVTDMNGTFANASVFNQPLNNWTVSSVTNMATMFAFATAFNQPLNNWNVSNVQTMNSMFYGASAFNQDLGSWDVAQVTDMNNMFRSTPFNYALNDWNVSSVTSMASMFNGATAFNQPLNNWDVSSVTTMVRMFVNAASFNQDLGDWDLSSVTTLENMLDQSGLSCENYDNTLIGWAAGSQTPNSLTFGAAGLGYDTPAQTAHNTLSGTKAWTISDAGLTPGCAVALPIKLTPGSFKADIEGNSVYLSWSTSTEINNSGFSIQKSTDAVNWSTIGFSASRASGGNSTSKLSYDFTDVHPASGNNYYRLIQSDISGLISVSDVISVNYTQGKNGLTVYPNPAHSFITIKGLHAGDKGRIYAANGQFVNSFEANGASMRMSIDQFAAGVYYIKIKAANNTDRSGSFIVK